MRVRKAVFPAAGLGTRFLPATKAQPKEMLTVVDKPQIQYVVEECVVSGIEHVIIVTGKGGAIDEFRGWPNERGVLKRLTPQWLREPDLRSVVIGFEEAGRAHGGSGALYVRLRRLQVPSARP